MAETNGHNTNPPATTPAGDGNGSGNGGNGGVVTKVLANAKAVVADIYPDSYIEQDIASGVIFAPTEMIATTCWDLLADDARRDRLERQGFACIARRDIRILLAAALA